MRAFGGGGRTTPLDVRFNKLDLNLLVALDALFTHTNVSRAAEQLNMSQSSMSNALARLRDYFDDELLVQVGRRMELTPRAEVLKDAVKDLLLRVDSTITAQPMFDCATSQRTFTVLTADYVSATLLPRVLSLARREAPQVRFEIRPLLVPQPAHALERGEADLLIIAADYRSLEHPSELAYRDDWQCMVWAEHPTLRASITREQYLAADHLVVHPTVQAQALDSQLLQAAGIARREAVHTFSFTTQPSMVVGTDLVATLHGRLAREAALSLPVRCCPLPLPLPPIEVVIQWHKYRGQDPGLMWLRQVIARAAAELA